MAASKTAIFIVFVVYLSCILLVSVSGTEAGKKVHKPCSTDRDCDSQCFGGLGGPHGTCLFGECECIEAETEVTKPIPCKRDSDCPDSRECPKDYYYSCLHGECTCISV
ncbi:hypothetical protein EUTSA_v10000382mg [Eutrema salsugineum]|uniref:Defensin-like protein n=1 Tax=Eutrema salsugineum TaxID=72664 RepID=V4LUA3_EUTSA|nr:defensin-like protein 290 [Eutrema salsugineum]ESQ46047.1 hypothetical protein EUTSA_v10000382mg [Eutrema salsugineum]